MRTMKTILALAAVMLAAAVSAQAEWVNGHFRSNGTYVNRYYRTPANGTLELKGTLSRFPCKSDHALCFDHMQSPGNAGEQRSHNHAHRQSQQVCVPHPCLHITTQHPTDDLFLHDRAYAANAVYQPGDGHGVFLAGDLDGGRAAEQRVRSIKHEADQPEPDREGPGAAAEFDDRDVARH